MSVQQYIRLLAAKGMPWHGIARCLGAYVKIVKKYVQMQNLSLRPSTRLAHTPVIDEYAR